MKIYLLLAAIVLLPMTPFNIKVHSQNTNDAGTEDDAAMQKLKNAIEANPDDLAAHEAYLKASAFSKWASPDNKEVIAQYEAWMKKYPRSAIVPYALGYAFHRKESPRAKTYLLKAIENDPKFAKAYFDLWVDAGLLADPGGQEYLLKAKNADPENARYALFYAISFEKTDFEKYKKLSLQILKDFPESNEAASALIGLAERTIDQKTKFLLYEQLKNDFPADQFIYTNAAIRDYFNLLLPHQPQKALTLALSMHDLKWKEERFAREWQGKMATVKNYMEAKTLLAQGKATEALVFTEKISDFQILEPIFLFKMSVLDASGKTGEAYKKLLMTYVKAPTLMLHEQMINYGKKLGKDKKAVENDIWYIRDTAAKQTPNFSLENYYTKTPTSLSDCKGKVVLLTYWFPGCGPCRLEFPHFENVLRKFKGKGVVYLGINIEPYQDEYVLPLMKSQAYSFIPLRDTKDWEKCPLENRGRAPVNYLIDGNSKIIFSGFRTDENNEETLELMISSMLERKKTNKN